MGGGSSPLQVSPLLHPPFLSTAPQRRRGGGGRATRPSFLSPPKGLLFHFLPRAVGAGWAPSSSQAPGLAASGAGGGEPGGAEAPILWCRDKSGTVSSDGRPGRAQREASPPRPPLEAAAPRADAAAVAGTDQRRGIRRSAPSSSWPRRVVPGGLRPSSELSAGPPSRPQALWPGRSLAWRQHRLTHPRFLFSHAPRG